jgi:PGF-pre-PGF domain-containing protein
MQTNSMRLIHSVIILLFLIMMAGIGSADEVNVELVSHLGGVVESVAVEGNYAYIGQGQDFVVLDITDAVKPIEIGRVTTSSDFYYPVISGNYAYLINDKNGLEIVDITNPSSPTLAGSYDTPTLSAIAVSGNYAYVTDYDNGLMILNISVPSSPVLVGSYDTDIVQGISVSGNYAYIVGGGLEVVDISDPSSPTLAGRYDTEGSDIVVSNNYAYVANEDSGLVILDISDPSSPIFTGIYAMNGSWDVTLSGNYAYISVYNHINNSAYLEIVDISDPTAPAFTGNYNISGPIAVAGNYAYIANWDEGLTIIDISNPSVPTFVDSSFVDINTAFGIVVEGNYTYLANGNGFVIVDTSNASTPTLIGSYDSEYSIEDIAVAGNYAYLIDYWNGFVIVDVSDPSSPAFVYSNYTYNALGVTIEGNYAYVATADGLAIFNINDPSSPKIVGNYEIKDSVDIAVIGSYAYLVDYWNGLVILDITNPSAPTFEGKCDTSSWVHDITVSGNYAYLASDYNGLFIVDISSPSSPTIVGNYQNNTTIFYPNDVAVAGNYAYLAAYQNGLMILNITDSSSPTVASIYDTVDSACGVALSGNYVYVADNGNGLVILRVGSAPDSIPPASVTNLKETGVGSSWINWTWTNPTNADFSHVMVYLNGTFVTNTSDNSINSYNATGLAEGITYTIGLQTADIFGNINSTWMNDSSTTLKLPKVSNVSGTNITTSSITLVWEASNDTSKVEIHRNDLVLGNVSGSTTYVDTNLSSGTTYSYTLIPYNISELQGKAVSVSLRTTSSSSGGGGGGGSSTSKSSSSGGGGGGAGSAEDFANVAIKDADSEYLRINANVTYEFKKEGNPIQSVSFYSLKNSGEITSSIEVLNNRSKLVNSTPEGILYKYVNIWVGKSGFATAANIKDAKVRFNVQSSWINDMGLSPADVKLQRYNGAAWEVLPTNVESNTTDYVVFESQTSGFSPFAITAERQVVASVPAEAATTPIQKEDAVVQETQPEKTPGFGFSMAILVIGILAAGYAYVKRSQK